MYIFVYNWRLCILVKYRSIHTRCAWFYSNLRNCNFYIKKVIFNVFNVKVSGMSRCHYTNLYSCSFNIIVVLRFSLLGIYSYFSKTQFISHGLKISIKSQNSHLVFLLWQVMYFSIRLIIICHIFR